ncbi:MAG: hypothetical protein DI636_09645 [Pelagerythrobacter marensis]|uniref:DUF4402 domain-containing protein n=1 Tax=Qipengyuania sp. YIM B01966 TaxID=2778646 RepID=UPI000DB3B225|nr:DUF4402 domain-containing protein [Qipengyuania sp. YIM B01966]PZO67931.1 MAG: hypothetical protein DI636_09645 [Pelagerythrobacter marensis]
MKNVFRLGAVAAAFAVMATGTTAYAADNADATATVEVMKPLTLTKTADLNFGQALVSGAGTVAVSPAGALTCASAGVVCSGAVNAAAFDITGGTAAKKVSVHLPTVTNLVRIGAAAGTTAASDLIGFGSLTTDAVLNATTGDREVTLGSTGAGSFKVGGTLTFDGSEVPGVYEATFNVSVDYS